jgi:hypothetical protein
MDSNTVKILDLSPRKEWRKELPEDQKWRVLEYVMDKVISDLGLQQASSEEDESVE